MVSIKTGGATLFTFNKLHSTVILNYRSIQIDGQRDGIIFNLSLQLFVNYHHIAVYISKVTAVFVNNPQPCVPP